MALDKLSLRRLRKRLPNQFMEAALGRLGGQGREMSKSYISQVINGNRFDQQVIEVLIAVAEDHQKELSELKARARGAQQPA